MSRVLVVDDDRMIRHLVNECLSEQGVSVCEARTAAEAIDVIHGESPDVVLLDLVLPRTSGLDVFRQIQQIDRKLPVIFITGAGDSETAIEAMQAGAYDYVPKPLDLPQLTRIVRRALKSRRIMHVPVAVEAGEDASADGDLFIGSSPQMVDVFKNIGRVAGQDVTVLIRGESGTGKELAARAIYQHSSRSSQAFIAVNCAALPDTLLESELLGHEKGAFTGAEQRRIGKFEQCDGGTIFLDEVGDMSPLLQSKVLRLLQEQKFERVGGNRTIETDVRIIAATNRNLEQMVEQGTFRSDLYYRLNGVTIALPPLCERGDDIVRLLQFYLTRACREMGKMDVEGIAPAALEQLTAYDWPGNVRELQSVVNQMLLKLSGTVIGPECLPTQLRTDTAAVEDVVRKSGEERANEAAEKPAQKPADDPTDDPTDGTADSDTSATVDELEGCDLRAFVERQLAAGSNDVYAEVLEYVEKYLLTRVLRETGGNQSQAARRLGITRGKLRDRIGSYEISVDRIVSLPSSPDES